MFITLKYFNGFAMAISERKSSCIRDQVVYVGVCVCVCMCTLFGDGWDRWLIEVGVVALLVPLLYHICVPVDRLMSIRESVVLQSSPAMAAKWP